MCELLISSWAPMERLVVKGLAYSAQDLANVAEIAAQRRAESRIDMEHVGELCDEVTIAVSVLHQAPDRLGDAKFELPES